MQHTPTALIVAGPTCSGKSALAFSLAKRFDGHIINADSMQVYRDLRVITARPPEEETTIIPHRLYGVLDAAENGSVAWWRQQAFDAIDAAFAQRKLPILCGGTGMYLRALVQGLVEVPDPGPEARHAARQKLAEVGAPAMHAALMEIDPEGAARIAPNDGQRIARLWEVRQGTGQTLGWWHQHGQLPPAPCRFVAVRLDPPRAQLREAIAARFDDMMVHGAMDEVAALKARQLGAHLPAMRAHGVPELLAHLNGQLTQDEAVEKAVIATGQYTRRQATWFRHHLLAQPANTRILLQRFGGNAQFSESNDTDTEIFIHQRLTRN